MQCYRVSGKRGRKRKKKEEKEGDNWRAEKKKEKQRGRKGGRKSAERKLKESEKLWKKGSIESIPMPSTGTKHGIFDWKHLLN